jgi:isoaspartyl peptidase/L-asparaginase-like protein (Ntn-hydrolase superfamily)
MRKKRSMNLFPWKQSKRKAGAVAGITKVKNPITAAHSVMVNTPHVFIRMKMRGYKKIKAITVFSIELNNL